MDIYDQADDISDELTAILVAHHLALEELVNDLAARNLISKPAYCSRLDKIAMTMPSLIPGRQTIADHVRQIARAIRESQPEHPFPSVQ